MNHPQICPSGTKIYRHGVRNQLAARLRDTQRPCIPTGILESIRASYAIFEKLAREWSSAHQDDDLLLRWLERARASVIEKAA